jgi:formylmethanofuran dehydrogenase subunit D
MVKNRKYRKIGKMAYSLVLVMTEHLKELGLDKGDEVLIYNDGNKIVIEKVVEPKYATR